MDPLIGVLVGGGLTFIGTVLGSVVTQLWTSRRERDRQDREERQRRDRELRSVRAEWASAAEEAWGATESDDLAWMRVSAEPDAAVAAQKRAERAIINRQLQDAKARLRAATTRLLLIDARGITSVDPLAVEAKIVALEHSAGHVSTYEQVNQARNHLRAIVQAWPGKAASRQLTADAGVTAALPGLGES